MYVCLDPPTNTPTPTHLHVGADIKESLDALTLPYTPMFLVGLLVLKYRALQRQRVEGGRAGRTGMCVHAMRLTAAHHNRPSIHTAIH